MNGWCSELQSAQCSQVVACKQGELPEQPPALQHAKETCSPRTSRQRREREHVIKDENPAAAARCGSLVAGYFTCDTL